MVWRDPHLDDGGADRRALLRCNYKDSLFTCCSFFLSFVNSFLTSFVFVVFFPSLFLLFSFGVCFALLVLSFHIVSFLIISMSFFLSYLLEGVNGHLAGGYPYILHVIL